MRLSLPALLVLVVNCGCTHVALERRTVKQASTLTDLQYQEVLDNLAMFVCNPEMLPWHVKLKSGTVQVADLRSGVLAGVAGGTGDNANSIGPGGTAQRTILGQWDVEPATDTDELELLQLAYKKAVRPMDQQVDKEIRFQMWQLLRSFEFISGLVMLLRITEDAVEDVFGNQTERLKSLVAQPDLNLSEKQAIELAIAHIAEAEEALLTLIRMQDTTEQPWFPTEQELVKYVRLLETPNQPNIPDNTDAAQYAIKFNQYVERLVRSLYAAQESLTQVNSAEQVAHWVRYVRIEAERDVRKRVLYLNPFRAQRIQRAICHESPFVYKNPIRRYFTCDEPEGKWANAEGLLLMILARKYLISGGKTLPPRNAMLIDQAQSRFEKLRDLQDERSPFRTVWFQSGHKKDIPNCACYVGHYRGCGTDCYVWAMPEDIKTLSAFTVILHALAPIGRQELSPGRGAAFSPGTR